MANPFALGAALGRLVKVTCPHCGHHKLVSREPKAYRTCPRCKRPFRDPAYQALRKRT